jgi:8-hydroxy-5-deazaflavin:NADPH oxidoreductase
LLLQPKFAAWRLSRDNSADERLDMERAAVTLPRLAVLGAGHVGPVVARLAVRSGYRVAIATSGDPANLALITEMLIPGAEPRWAADAVADSDIVVVAIPLHRFLNMDPTPFSGKLVVDAMNYWPASDGVLEAFEGAAASSEIVASRLAGSAVVKALNHIGYHELEENARAAGSPDRRATGVAGDDPEAVAAVAEFVERIGYDPVRLASLRDGQVLQPGGPVFGLVLTQPEFEVAIGAEPVLAGVQPLGEARSGKGV